MRPRMNCITPHSCLPSVKGHFVKGTLVAQAQEIFNTLNELSRTVEEGLSLRLCGLTCLQILTLSI